MAGAENEEVAFVLKVLDQEKTKKALESARNTVKEMTEAEKRWALEDAAAARAQAQAREQAAAAQRASAQEARDHVRRQEAAYTRTLQSIEGMKVAYQTMRTIFVGAYNAARTLGEYSADLRREYTELESAHSSFMRALATGVSTGGGFTDFIDGITNTFRTLAPVARDAGSAISGALGELRDWLGYFSGGRIGNTEAGTEEGIRAAIRRRHGARATEYGYMSEVTDDYDTGWGTLGEYGNLPQSTPGSDNLDFEQGGILSSGRTEMPYGYSENLHGRTRGAGGGNQGGGGGAGQRDWLSTAGYGGAAAGETAAAEAHIADLYRQQTVELREQLRLLDVRNEGEQAAMRAVQERKDLEAEEHRQALVWAQERKDVEKQLRDWTRDQILGSITAFNNLAQTGASIFSQLATRQEQQIAQITSVLKASGASQDAIERATKAQTERLDRLKKAEGGFLIAYNTVMAATSIAQAASAYGEMRYDAMASFITAAAGYAAAAVMAGVRLGDDGSGGSAAAAPAASAPSYSPQAARPSAGENTSTNVTIFTWGYSNSGLGRQVERARMEYSRSGGDGDMLPAGGYDQ